jgi:hypothetical protein
VGDSCLGLAKSIEWENMWKAQKAQNDAIQWGVDVESSALSEEGWPGVPMDAVWPYRIGADGWPSIEGGVEVSVEVCSDASAHQREHSACRCL